MFCRDAQTLVITILRGTCIRGDIVIRISFAFAQHISSRFCHLSGHRSSKSKEIKKEAKEKIRHTNKQATKQINTRTYEKKRRKQTSDVACFFFGPMQWLEPLRAAKRYK